MLSCYSAHTDLYQFQLFYNLLTHRIHLQHSTNCKWTHCLPVFFHRHDSSNMFFLPSETILLSWACIEPLLALWNTNLIWVVWILRESRNKFELGSSASLWAGQFVRWIHKIYSRCWSSQCTICNNYLLKYSHEDLTIIFTCEHMIGSFFV